MYFRSIKKDEPELETSWPNIISKNSKKECRFVGWIFEQHLSAEKLKLRAMTQIIVLIFAVLVPVVIAILILRAWKKYDKKDYEPTGRHNGDQSADENPKPN